MPGDWKLPPAGKDGKRASGFSMPKNGHLLIEDLAMASDVMILTSAQEGFGLPYLEAAALEKPLIARHLPNVVPDLIGLGFSFPHLYKEILIAPTLLDLKSERARQQMLWRAWKSAMPSSCRRLAGRPLLLDLPSDQPVPFSRLTLTGQLEVLAIPSEQSWEACVRDNPLLRRWRALAQTGRLAPMQWPGDGEKNLGGPAYAARFWNARSLCLAGPARRPRGRASPARFDRSTPANQFSLPHPFWRKSETSACNRLRRLQDDS